MQVKGRCRGDCKADPREYLLWLETRKVSGIYGLVWLLRKSCPSNKFLTYIPKDILEIPVLQDALFNSIFKGYHGQIKLVHGLCYFLLLEIHEAPEPVKCSEGSWNKGVY